LDRAAIDTAAGMARLGDVAGAARLLTETLGRTPSPGGEARTAILEALIGHLVFASRHREALSFARELEAHIGVARIPVVWNDLLTLLVRFFPRLRAGGIFLRFIGWAQRGWTLQNGATLGSIRAVQLALFWYDIRACQRLSLLQLVLARSDYEVRRALAWLGYSYAYGGRGGRGIPLLRHAIADAHRAKDETTLSETYSLLAIAYQMCGDPPRALHYHRLFQRRYASKSPFYKLLSHTNALVTLLSLGKIREVKAQLDDCFLASYALDVSRHHLQIYGVHAVIMAIEGRGAEATKALAMAKNAAQANDNPLDWTIYARLAALTLVVSESWGDALACATEGLARNREYGDARHYARELSRLIATARDPKRIMPWRAKFLEASARYLASEVRQHREGTADWKLSQLADQLSEALRSHFDFDPSRPPTIEDLRAKLSRTFKTAYVISAPDLASLKAVALRERGIERSFLTTESDGELRFVCPGGRFFLGLECNRTSEFREPIAVGILLERLDALSESLVRAAFRLVLSQYVFVHSIRISRDIQAKQQRAAAVGTLAQMLAHDVRRPFHMLRAALDSLERAREPNEFRRQVKIVLPEVKLAADTADALIADVLEISTGSKEACPEPVAPEAILAGSLTETLRGYPTADVSFHYDFRHEEAINVEPKKVQRVFSNILANAIQAMDHRGHISFSTSQVVENGAKFVSFVIANDGPAIPDADVANLFDPFFTRSKPTGTGLGLAIAHRVVTAHGGTIQCLKTGGKGAAFRFTLPSIAAEVAPAPELPARASEIISPDAHGPDSCAASDPGGGAARDPLEVAIVDDSLAFLLGWQTALAGSARAYFFTSPEAFWQAVETDGELLARLSAVVTDYRFGNSRQTGVSFARAVKERRVELPVFLSSSGHVSRREIQGVIDMELDKDAVSWPALSAALGETRQRRAQEAQETS
jgi:signal transduction histidine kinase